MQNTEDSNNEIINTTKNKVLVVSYYFPPMGLSGVQRTLKFVKYLPSYDWSPIVLTTSEPLYYAFDESLMKDIPNEALIYRTEKDPTAPIKRKKNKTMSYPSAFTQKVRRIVLNTFLQPDSRRSWKKHAIEIGEKIIKEHRINVVFATAPPFTGFWVAYELAKKHDLPLVLDYRDMWIDNPYYYYVTPFHKLYATNLENQILRYASKIIVLTRSMKETLIKRYKSVSYQDISIIPHGFDSEDFKINKESLSLSNKFVLTYSGIFADDLTPKHFLHAIGNLIKKYPNFKSELELRFIGFLRKADKRLIKKLGLEDNVYAPGYLPHNEAIINLMESDVLWMLIYHPLTTPGKFFEFLGTNKPMILCSDANSLTKIAEETGATIICPPKDINAMEKAVWEYYQLWKKKQLPTPNFINTMQYDRKLLTEELARELSLNAVYY